MDIVLFCKKQKPVVLKIELHISKPMSWYPLSPLRQPLVRPSYGLAIPCIFLPAANKNVSRIPRVAKKTYTQYVSYGPPLECCSVLPGRHLDGVGASLHDAIRIGITFTTRRLGISLFAAVTKRRQIRVAEDLLAARGLVYLSVL